MVEHLAVNQRVAGSSPAPGAKQSEPNRAFGFLCFFSVAELRTGGSVERKLSQMLASRKIERKSVANRPQEPNKVPSYKLGFLF
jgi:hypothetical protein